MSKQEALALKVKKYTGQNPFTYSQARDFPLSKLNQEFVPTSKFWNRFNVSNEILIGTRGSGKTILLRMMSYTSLSNLSRGHYGEQFKSKLPQNDIKYLGFYVPLRLRVLGEIGKTDDKVEERRRFSFLFNCASAGSIIDEVITIIDEQHESETEKLLKERELINKLKEAWGLPIEQPTSTLRALQEQIDRLFDKIRADWNLQAGEHAFDRSLLEPVISVLPMLNNALGFSHNHTTWMACFDEAEYLNPNLQRVLNTIMRSESRGLAVKIATLPFHYNEFMTETDGEYVQPEGDDFRFESIDYSEQENDFIELTDNLVLTRLASTGLFDELPETRVLQGFVGMSSAKDLISIYRNIFKGISDTKIDEEIALSLRKNNTTKSKAKFNSGQIKRYKPLYLLRELYKKNRAGNTKVPRLSGDIMIRKVSDGNVRRFIQICDAVFEISRAQYLRANQQHDAVWKFAEQRFKRSQSVYREGFLLYKLIESISDYLFYKLHDGPLIDVGVEFTVSQDLLGNSKIKDALEMGVAYSYFICPKPDLFYGISSTTRFRLANAIAAYKWLPMRAGTGITISGRSEVMRFLSSTSVLQPKTVENLPLNLELDF